MEIKQVLENIAILSEKNNCFSLKFYGYDKISSHFYNPKVLNILKKIDKLKNSVTLGFISEGVKYSDGKWELHTTDYVPEDFPDSVLLMQILNLSEEGVRINTKYDKFISKELQDKWKNSQVKPNDIIMAITGTIGLSVLIPEGFPKANLNQALARIVLKEEVEINDKKVQIHPKFVLLFINSLYGRLQLDRLGGARAGQSGLSTTEIKSLKLPLPDYDVQEKIVKEVEKIKQVAQQKKKDYHNSLNKIKQILSDVLDIKNRDFKNHFITKNDEINDRLDCYFYHPELKYLKKSINDLETSKVDIVSCKDLDIKTQISKEEFEKNKTKLYKYIDIGNTEKDLGRVIGYEEDILFNLPTRARQICETNDVLQPRPTGSIKGVMLMPKEYDKQLVSTGFILIKPKDYDEALVLWAVLKSDIVQKQMFYLQSGSIQPEITPTNFQEYVLLPIPKGKFREELVKKSNEYFKEAVIYKREYKEKLEEAKKRFLELIF